MFLPFFSLDIEPTNRCNAKCYFCPRDKTPHQGLMDEATFDQALRRALEFQPIARERFGKELKVNLCGLGEPLLNRLTPQFVAKVREAGFECALASNGALLDERRGAALLEAGLQRIAINVGEEGDDYEQIYQLPFEKTRDNVVRFAELAEGRCEVQIVLVNHRGNQAHLDHMVDFWRSHGLDDFVRFDLINRGGALFVDHMQYESYPERAEVREMFAGPGQQQPICHAPFVFLFIGYDGQYYLCCSDWTKEAPLDSVFDRSIVDVNQAKLDHVISREPVCLTCNLDPVNRLTDALRAQRAGDIGQRELDEVRSSVSEADATARLVATELGGRPDDATAPRRLIPVRAV